MQCSEPTSALVRLSALLCCGALACGGSDGPTGKTDPLTPTATTAAIEISPSVDASTRTQVATFLGLAGSLPASGSGALAMPEGARSAVFAMNASGEPVFGAMVAPGSTVALDARSSALLLTRLVAPPSLIVAGGAAALEAQFAAEPGFQALVDSVASRATRGLSLTNTPESIEQAAAVANGLLAPQPAAARLRATATATASDPEASVARFLLYPDVTADPAVAALPSVGGGTVTLHSGLAAPLKFATPAGELKIDRAVLCPSCWRTAGFTSETGQFAVPQDGKLAVTVDLDRDMVVVQTVLDMAGVIFAKLSDKIPSKDTGAKAVMKALGGLLNGLRSLLTGKKPSDIAPVFVDFFKTNSPALAAAFATLVPDWKEVLVGKAVTAAASPVMRSIVDGIKLASAAQKIGLTYAAALPYWSEDPEQAEWCIEDRGLYGGCSDRILVSPEKVTLEVDKGQELFAVVYDAMGRILSGRKVGWASDATTVATIPAGPSQTAAVTGRKDGTATVIATVFSAVRGKITDNTTVVVGVDSTAIYKAVLAGKTFGVAVDYGSEGVEQHVLTLNSDGTGAYIYADLPEQKFSMTWTVTKANGRYYFVDRGFFGGTITSVMDFPPTRFGVSLGGATWTYVRQ